MFTSLLTSLIILEKFNLTKFKDIFSFTLKMYFLFKQNKQYTLYLISYLNSFYIWQMHELQVIYCFWIFIYYQRKSIDQSWYFIAWVCQKTARWAWRPAWSLGWRWRNSVLYNFSWRCKSRCCKRLLRSRQHIEWL